MITFQDNEKYETYKDMTGTVRLTIKNTSKKDKGKYTAKIFRCEKEVTETSLNVVGEYYWESWVRCYILIFLSSSLYIYSANNNSF